MRTPAPIFSARWDDDWRWDGCRQSVDASYRTEESGKGSRLILLINRVRGGFQCSVDGRELIVNVRHGHDGTSLVMSALESNESLVGSETQYFADSSRSRPPLERDDPPSESEEPDFSTVTTPEATPIEPSWAGRGATKRSAGAWRALRDADAVRKFGARENARLYRAIRLCRAASEGPRSLVAGPRLRDREAPHGLLLPSERSGWSRMLDSSTHESS